MAIENVKKIQHTHDSRMVNALLKAGWELVGMTPGTDEFGASWPLYTLGWAQEGAPVEVRQDW